MKIREVGLAQAAGAVMVHTRKLGPGRAIKKGRLLTEDDARALAEAGVDQVTVAILEPFDVGEDEAARRVAEAAVDVGRDSASAGRSIEGHSKPFVKVGRAATGRANLFAEARGLVVVSRDRIDAVNLVHESITIATAAPFAIAGAGELIATVKIIPFAVPEAIVEAACVRAREAAPLVRVAPFHKKRAGLVLTTLPGAGENELARASESQRLRMASLGGELVREARVPHEVSAVARAIRAMIDEGIDLVMVLGASAIVDRRDVIPLAIEAAGGVVDHFGMPVDPGNLLLLGHAGGAPVVGVPGCARSLKPSGFDWVLERIAAGVPIAREDIMRLGAGGLLSELDARPSPRRASDGEPAGAEPEPAIDRPPPRVAAIILAAGMSRRMGAENKLLAEVSGKPIVARVVDALLETPADPVIVVVGHEAARIREALAERRVRFVENPAYEEGLGASLRAGVEALGDGVDGALVALGDMPWIRAEHANQLLRAFDPSGPSTIYVPVHDRRRGHPVLWSSRHFPAMKKLHGDVGARALLERHADEVLAIEVSDAAIHLDVDTPEMLEKVRNSGAGAAMGYLPNVPSKEP